MMIVVGISGIMLNVYYPYKSAYAGMKNITGLYTQDLLESSEGPSKPLAVQSRLTVWSIG
jgi:hypothetical protein